MKSKITLIVITVILVISSIVVYFKMNDGTCSGGKNCTACSTCNYCKNCSKDGGTCSVCK